MTARQTLALLLLLTLQLDCDSHIGH